MTKKNRHFRKEGPSRWEYGRVVNMLQNLVSRLNHFSDHLQGFVLFCFVLFCFLFFVFFFGGGGGGNFPVQCLGHAYVNGQLVFTCVFAFDHLAKCLQTSSFEKLFSLFLRTEYGLAEFTSNTLLSCPTAILCSDLDSWCFSIVKKQTV